MWPFARPGNVFAVAGAVPLTGAVAGAWTAGPVAEARLRLLPFILPVFIRSARCTFAFAGVTTDGTTPVVGASTVTLSSWLALRRGDTASDVFGNTVSA